MKLERCDLLEQLPRAAEREAGVHVHQHGHVGTDGFAHGADAVYAELRVGR